MSLLSKLRPLQGRLPASGTGQVRDGQSPSAPPQSPMVATGPSHEPPVGRFSNGLKEFLWQIGSIGRGTLLDVGPVSQATVSYFGERGFKVYTEDVLASWHQFRLDEEEQMRLLPLGAEPPDTSSSARAQRFLVSNLRYPDDSLDAVLLWDLFDYLDRETMACFMERIWSMLREGGAILALFHMRMPETFRRYRVLDAHNLELVPARMLVPPQNIFRTPREIEEMFERFRTSKAFVGRDQLREGVFVK
jgi:hypothetical protein